MVIKFTVIGSVLILLISAGVSPFITVSSITTTQDTDVVAMTTLINSGIGQQVCTVSLTQHQVDEIQMIFNELQIRLSQAGSLKETQDIFSETIDSLQCVGLLSDSLIVKQLKRVVADGIATQSRDSVLHSLSRPSQRMSSNDGVRNSFCLIAGNSSNTHFATLAKRIALRLYDIVDYGTGTALLRNVALVLWLVFKQISTMRQSILYRDGVHLGVAISYGNYHYAPYPDWFSPANGWLWTLGVNGKQNISGSFWGQRMTSGWQPEDDWFMNYSWRGCLGFTGLITYLGEDRAYYLGSALHVNVGPNRP